jgi:hypothetical protein
MIVDGTYIFRRLQAVYALCGVSYTFFLHKIEPLYWNTGHVCGPTESLVLGLFGALLISHLFRFRVLESQSQSLYKAIHLFSAAAMVLYILASHVSSIMYTQTLFGFVLLHLLYGFSTSGRNSAGVNNLTPLQHTVKNVWVGVLVVNGFVNLFLPAVAESINFAVPANTAHMRAILFFLALLQFELASLTHAVNDRESFRNDFLVGGLLFAYHIYFVHPAASSLVLKSYPITCLASAALFF